jgi:YVTN family beta-propeller protein
MHNLLTTAGAIVLAGAFLPGVGPAAAPSTSVAGACQGAVYVVSSANATVTPVNTVTRKAGRPIKLPEPGDHDAAGDIVVAPDSKTAYVLNGADENQSVTPINTVTNQAGHAIPASNYGAGPMMAVTPNSKRLYVLGANVTLINLVTGRITAIKFPHEGNGTALSFGADSTYLYALSAHTLTRIRAQTNKPGPGISLPFSAFGMAVTPNGKTVYVSDWNDDTVVPISTATGTLGTPIKVGKQPFQIVITPDGKTAYVDNADSNSVTPINTKTNTPGKAIKVPVAYGLSHMLALTPDGKKLLVLGVDTVTPISTASDKAAKPIKVGSDPADIAVTGNDKTAWIANQGSSSLVSVNFDTEQASKPIKVGASPVSIALKGCPA